LALREAKRTYSSRGCKHSDEDEKKGRPLRPYFKVHIKRERERERGGRNREGEGNKRKGRRGDIASKKRPHILR
jgi:hypothetical protein